MFENDPNFKQNRESVGYPIVSQEDLIALMSDDENTREEAFKKLGIIPIKGEQYAIDLDGFSETQFITIDENGKAHLDKIPSNEE